jgi:hypothetical protein
MPARRSPARALAPIVLAAALLPGCGGGGGDANSTTTAPLTRAELIASGDEICRHAAERYGQPPQEPPTTSAEAADQTQRLISITGEELAQIRSLSPPDELGGALDRYLHARERGVAILKRELKAAQSNDPGAFAAARAKMAAGQVARLRLAQAVGFADCSRPGAVASGD